MSETPAQAFACSTVLMPANSSIVANIVAMMVDEKESKKKLRRAQDPKKQHHNGVRHLTQAQSLSQNGKPRKAIKPKYCEFAIFVCLKLWKAQTSQEVAISCLGDLKSSRGETQRPRGWRLNLPPHQPLPRSLLVQIKFLLSVPSKNHFI